MHLRQMNFTMLNFTAIETPNMRVQISFWTGHIEPGPFLKARHTAIISIYSAFKENGIYEVKVTARPPSGTITNQNG